MIDYGTLYLFLILEAVILLGLGFLVILHRFVRTYFDRKIIHKKEELSNYYLSLIESKKAFNPLEHPKCKRLKKAMLQVLEEFNYRIAGEPWCSIRNSIVDSLLLDQARRYSKSHFWIYRNFAARVFYLHAQPQDEAIVLKLMNDKKFLVRCAASFAAVFMESQKGIMKIFESILNEPGYSQFIYRDALVRGSEKVFGYIIEIAQNPKYHNAALEILGSRSWGKNIPFLQNDLSSKDPLTRHLSLKVLIRNPLENNCDYFSRGAQEADPRTRALSMEGYGIFCTNQSYEVLEKGLNDPDWEVRLAAGKALKRAGDAGVSILNQQKEGPALEVSKYVLTFG